MVQHLEIILEDRVDIMLFRLFDRSNQGYFDASEFIDILAVRMIPNYRKLSNSSVRDSRYMVLTSNGPKRRSAGGQMAGMCDGVPGSGRSDQRKGG